jgi:hypothetical protein
VQASSSRPPQREQDEWYGIERGEREGKGRASGRPWEDPQTLSDCWWEGWKRVQERYSAKEFQKEDEGQRLWSLESSWKRRRSERRDAHWEEEGSEEEEESVVVEEGRTTRRVTRDVVRRERGWLGSS